MEKIDPEELEEAIERAQFRSGGGGRKSRPDEGFGLEKKGKKVKEKISEEARKNSEKLSSAKRTVVEKIQNLLERESNPALFKGVRNYFEWVRYGLLALSEEGQKQEIMRNQDISTEFMRASGPGGQNVNKTSSAVSIRHNPSRIFLKEMGSRTQSENLSEARKRMFEKLEAHLNKWKLVAKGRSSDEVMAEMFEETNVGRKLEPRENEVMEDIARRLREGKNL
jgi:prolyl oligopeptidase PreP (S9A serine peptidase family)